MPPRKDENFRVDRERVERVARIYHTTADAAQAMGIARSAFLRLCKKYGIEVPGRKGKGSKGRLSDLARHREE